MANSCAICAKTYDSALDPTSEKPLLPGRYLDCCERSICSKCLLQNKRYQTYCPYCQISTLGSEPSVLPQGQRDPPTYSSLDDRIPRLEEKIPGYDEQLPAYSAHQPVQPPLEKGRELPASDDVLHFVVPSDTMLSLSFAYGVPINALRKANSVYSDHLLQARRTALIPGEYYKGGVSLSPRPLEGEEEEAKKHKIRRWMMTCKVAEYDVALLYLQQADWGLEAAVEAYKEDERWEKEHPLEAKQRGKKGKAAKDAGMRRFVGPSSAPGANGR